MLLLAVFGMRIPQLYQLYVLHDEFGYWANAAHFAGYDWSGIAGMSPYYSYGYSFLLVPFLLLFHNSVWMYRAAVLLNVILYVGSFLVAFSCARHLFRDKDPRVLATVCFFITLYCNNLLQTNMTWSEALLYFVFWLMFYTLILYCEKQSMPSLICFALETLYIYMVHQRALGVAAAAVLTLLITFVVDKGISVKRLILLFGVAGAVFAAAVLLKEDVIGRLWNWEDAAIAGQNDFSGQWQKLAAVFRLDGFVNLICHVGGKLFYLAVASCSVIFWGVLQGIRKIKEKTYQPVFLFLFLSLAATVGIVSIYVAGGTRVDCVVYGRYLEFVVGPLLMMGCIHLLGWKVKAAEYLVYLAGVLAAGALSCKAFEGKSTFTYIMSAGGCLFYDNETDSFRLLACVIFAVAAGAVVFAAARFKKAPLWAAGTVLIVGYWWGSANEALTREVLPGQRYLKNVSFIAEMIEAVGEEVPIYYVKNENVPEYFNWRIENLQFLIPKRRIQWIDRASVESLEGEYYLVQYRADNLDMSRYCVVNQAHNLVVMVPDGSALQDKCISYDTDRPYVFNDTMMYSGTQSGDHRFDSDHKEGFLVFCQDLVLTPGRYRVDIELSVSEVEGDILGTADVSGDYGRYILFSENVSAENVSEGGVLHISFEFDCEETVTGAEFRFYTMGNARIQLTHMQYSMQRNAVPT